MDATTPLQVPLVVSPPFADEVAQLLARDEPLPIALESGHPDCALYPDLRLVRVATVPVNPRALAARGLRSERIGAAAILDDGMRPGIRKGDIVLFHAGAPIEDGAAHVIAIDGDIQVRELHKAGARALTVRASRYPALDWTIRTDSPRFRVVGPVVGRAGGLVR